jgi:chromosome segregation ATPase
MADPSKLDFADWFAVVTTGLVTGIGGAMAWFSHQTKKMDERMGQVEENAEKWDARHAEHVTQLAVIHTNQDHMTERLDEIRTAANSTNEKLDELAGNIVKVLMSTRNTRSS